MDELKRSFTYPQSDENWIMKTVIGALLFWIPIINFFFFGYNLASARLGSQDRLEMPEWDTLNEHFLNGFMVFLISLGYQAIPILVLILSVGGSLISLGIGSALGAGAGIAGGMVLWWILTMVFGFFMPMALSAYAATGQMADAFALGELWRRMSLVLQEYILAYAAFWIGSAIITCFYTIPMIGWIAAWFGEAYLLIVLSNHFGRLYREASNACQIP
ncbi:MAG: DUF4013 domain-containing protein [Solirubrobacterales bacterium]